MSWMNGFTDVTMDGRTTTNTTTTTTTTTIAMARARAILRAGCEVCFLDD